MPQPDAKPNAPAASLSMREFVQSLRPDGPGNLDELRTLMRAAGWLEHLPAIQDEHGVMLVGNRRLLVAQELGIAPNIKQVTFGDGPEADAQRMKLAVGSNVGGEGLSKEARKSAAEFLYGTGKNTLKQIAEALGVGFSTIQRDLKDFTHVGKIKPQGRGRPKGTVTRARSAASILSGDDEQDVTDKEKFDDCCDRAEQALSQGELGEASRAAAQVLLALAEMFDGKVVVNDELIALVRPQAANWHAIADAMERRRGSKASSKTVPAKKGATR